MEEKIKKFRDIWLGQRYRETPELGYQCVALSKMWAIHIGRPTGYWGGTAISGWRRPMDGWIRIENKIGSRPQEGDILFWAPTLGNKAGHTSVCTRDGGALWLTHMEQNGGRGNGTGTGSDAIRERRTTYYNLLGWKRAI